MANLGSITVPDPPTIADFPLKSDFGTGRDLLPNIAVHLFDQPGLKIEQRFQLGAGIRYRVRKDHLSCNELDQLRAHFQTAQGQYAQFRYTYYGPNGAEIVMVRYENPAVTFNHLVGMLSGDPGISLVQVAISPETYPVNNILDRFPDSAFDTRLSSQVHKMIPLLTIQDRKGGAPILISDRDVTLQGQTYVARLITWSGLKQSLGESSDDASFTLGNADGAWIQLVNMVNMYRAGVQLSLLHVPPDGSATTLVHMWQGYATGWAFDANGNFALPCSDGAFELTLSYPLRMVTRKCWKVFKGRYCPSTSTIPGDCPKTWEACNDRGVPKSFGGLVVLPQKVRVKDNSTGVHGFGRSVFTSVTVAQDTVYQRTVQEIYTDKDMIVSCDVAGGRDEGDFYSALGIVGEGPLGGYEPDLIQQKLDGQPPHDPKRGGGWRGIVGNDPALTSDYFGLDQAPWVGVPPNSTYAAGLAFAEIRRSDEAGLQLVSVADRAMTVTISGGIGGWTWTAPGARVWQPNLANCVWVAVNVWLRAKGLKCQPSNAASVPVAQMEATFDVGQAIAAAALCDLVVPKLVGTGTERQFPFRGVLKERKPVKEWLQEILNCCLGYFTFVNGKLWIGIRMNSSVLAGNAFTRATILANSLQIGPMNPRFNWLTVQFGDEEFDWQLNNSTVYDIDSASFVGTPESPQYLQNTMTLVGVSNKSQASRISITRLREELGGLGPTEQLNARRFSFRTTVLALRTMVGDIVSLQHDQMPTGYGEGRVQEWTLNPDYSIDIAATPTTDLMYDVTQGPKPDDIPAQPVPPELLQSPAGLAWMPNALAAFPGDPLYPDGAENTFLLQQDYNVTRDGIWDAALYVSGEFPVNQFVTPATQARILDIDNVAGGTLSGGQTVYLAVTMHTAEGFYSVPSNLSALWLPLPLSGQRLQLTLAAPPSGTWSGYDIWAGTDRRRIGLQASVEAPLPATYNFDGPVHQMTRGLPEQSAKKVRIQAKHVWHSGIAGVLITGVPANNQIQCNDAIGSTDNWVGRILSTLADQSDGSVPLWNFTVTAFNSTTGIFTVTPNCVRADPADSVEVGDVLIVRSIGVSAGADHVTDPLWNNFISSNQFGYPGLRNDEEVGRVARILFGKGAGQYRHIATNADDTLYITPDWDVIPDATSIIIIEDPEWVYFAESTALPVSTAGRAVTMRMRVDNLRDVVALVGGFLVDDQDRITDEEFAVYREIYVFGQPPTVRPLGPDAGPWNALATDHTLRCDTSLNDVVIQLPPLYVYQGRPLYVWNDGSNHVKVFAWPGETFYDGSAMIELSALGESVRITAA